LQVDLTWIEPDPIETCRFDRQVDMRMWGRMWIWIWIGLERMEHHGVLKTL
jgi:hypothetical protein